MISEVRRPLTLSLQARGSIANETVQPDPKTTPIADPRKVLLSFRRMGIGFTIGDWMKDIGGFLLWLQVLWIKSGAYDRRSFQYVISRPQRLRGGVSFAYRALSPEPYLLCCISFPACADSIQKATKPNFATFQSYNCSVSTKMGPKRVLITYGVDVDAVAGWLGSYEGEDSPNDISRGASCHI